MYRLLLNIGLVGYFGLFLLVTVGLGGYWAVYQQTPDQPIAFAHTVHAGELQLPCDFCHRYVEQGRQAGIPSLSRCMSCHRSIATERAEIKKLTRYVEEGRPVYWSRLHRLPDYIYFSHKRHSKGQIPCAACHGEVARMESVRQVRSLEMGWCLACHRDRGAPIDCTVCHK